jgi:hypothetical protein
VKDPFVLSGFKSAELTVAEEDKLQKKRNNGRLKPKHSSADTALFWLSLQQAYPIITKKVIEALFPFSTSYLCEAGFSAMNMIEKLRCILNSRNYPLVCELFMG